MLKKTPGWASRTASFSCMSSTLTARMAPSGGVSSPNRLMSALLNGRSHANAFPLTNQVRLAKRVPSVTSGSSIAIRAASSIVAGTGRDRTPASLRALQAAQHHGVVLTADDAAGVLVGDGET